MKGIKLQIGFTLAEVLITLGIIGVVAALTIPSLMTNYRKKVYVNKLKQTYSLLTQGFRQYMADEGLDDLSDAELPWKKDTDEFSKLFRTYFKVSQDCNRKYMPCFCEFSQTYVNGKLGKTSRKPYTCNVIVTLMNGVAICADSHDSGAVEDGGYTSGGLEKNSVIDFEIDVNGISGPNIGGYDLFWFSMDTSGQIFDPNYVKSGYDYNKDSLIGAFGKIMADGWKITYPIK